VSKPAAKLQTNHLLAKGTNMSEQRSSFMADLDQWSDREVIAPIADAYSHGPEEVIVRAKDLVKRSIRAKVHDSYRNGQSAGPRKAFKR
jgi:hypothetical protein